MVKFLTISALAFFLASCSSAKIAECPQMMCTQEFRMVQVKLKDISGNPVTAKQFSAIIKRTGQSTVQNNEPATVNNQGIYTVASDADVKNLSETGDVIIVTATDPATNRTVSGEFVVSGGKCACHINKVSGPEELTL